MGGGQGWRWGHVGKLAGAGWILPQLHKTHSEGIKGESREGGEGGGGAKMEERTARLGRWDVEKEKRDCGGCGGCARRVSKCSSSTHTHTRRGRLLLLLLLLSGRGDVEIRQDGGASGGGSDMATWRASDSMRREGGRLNGESAAAASSVPQHSRGLEAARLPRV